MTGGIDILANKTNEMNTTDFDYHLPPDLIAQTPLEPRDSSRLLVLDRAAGTVEHSTFRQLASYLRPNDLLVLNETRVIPARLFARKVPTGGRVEVLLLRRTSELTWEALVGGKGLHAGSRIQVEDGPAAEIAAELEGPQRLVAFDEALDPYLERAGHMPLPPYIHTRLEDPERYQTVFSKEPGSAAAPTAGLHFTPRLMDELQEQGVGFAFVTLHVGLDTFAPVNEDDPSEHAIHTEWCQLGEEAAEQINRTRQAGGRIVAVGTTAVRTLETAARAAQELAAPPPDAQADAQGAEAQVVVPFTGRTDLYILPGFQFQAVQAMITNFHLPRSTLIMLVSAFAGRERTLDAYETAKREGYRFYSFGDAMLIL
jgi:S-adenosylmethionine:tRNA ribosyltransferase-isomerase